MMVSTKFNLLMAAALVASPALAQSHAVSNPSQDEMTSDSSYSDTRSGSDAYSGTDEQTGDQAGMASDQTGIDDSRFTRDQEAGTLGRNERSESDYSDQRDQRGVYGHSVQITPQVGAMGFANANSTYDSRLVTGATVDFAAVPLLTSATRGMFGLESGFLLSHIGTANGTFVGKSDPGDSSTGANMWTVPIQLVAGVHVWDSVAFNARLGTHLLHRSENSTMLIGRSDEAAGSSTEFLPSAGVSAGFSLGKSVGITIRGDYIPTPALDMYMATLGATIPLG